MVKRWSLVALGLVLAACGGGSGAATTLAPTTTTTLAPTTTSTLATTTTTAPTTTTTDAPTTTAVALPAAPDPGIDGAVLFTDPEGDYTMWVNPDWPEFHGSFISGVEAWGIPTDDPGEVGGEPFAPNVTVLAQDVPAGVDIEGYLELSIDGAPVLLEGFELVEAEVVEGPGGPLAVMEYRGTTSGAALHFFAVFGLRADRAIIATFTALPDQYDDLLPGVEPYLFTLVPAP
jgi:hypothetical protein